MLKGEPSGFVVIWDRKKLQLNSQERKDSLPSLGPWESTNLEVLCLDAVMIQ
jgi:hypothetical protein